MSMIDRCVCFNITFGQIVEQARRDNLDFEGVRTRFGCGRGCALCVPYIKAALATGQIEFRPDVPPPVLSQPTAPPSDL